MLTVNFCLVVCRQPVISNFDFTHGDNVTYFLWLNNSGVCFAQWYCTILSLLSHSVLNSINRSAWYPSFRSVVQFSLDLFTLQDKGELQDLILRENKGRRQVWRGMCVKIPYFCIGKIIFA